MSRFNRRRRSLAGVLFTLLLWETHAMAVEKPGYEVVKTYPGFELRQYAPFVVAETEVKGAFDSVGNQAFRILADYIFGNNRKRERMAMTAPVSQRPVPPELESEPESESERIAMAAPEDYPGSDHKKLPGRNSVANRGAK